MQIHSGEKPHECLICSKQFTHKYGLNRHKQFHSGEKSFACSICKKQFTRKNGLNRHMLIHSGEKPFECPTCEKRFIRKEHLNDHLRIHSGEKPFVCSICSKQITHKNSLIRHMLIHSGEKPFDCPVCEKKFTHSSSLQEHVKSIHLNEWRFTCDVCKKGFQRKNALIKHLSGHRHEKLITNKSIASRSRPKSHFKQLKRNQRKLKQNLEQNSLLMSSLEGRCLKIVCNKLTEYEIKQFTSNGEITKEDKFKEPMVKQELITGEDLSDEQIPSCSYQALDMKPEPTEIAGPTCVNLFEDLFIKEETELSTLITN